MQEKENVLTKISKKIKFSFAFFVYSFFDTKSKLMEIKIFSAQKYQTIFLKLIILHQNLFKVTQMEFKKEIFI